MSKYKNILVAGAALVALSGAAMAGGKGGEPAATVNTALTVQWNVEAVNSLLTFYGEWVIGDFRAASVAVGNNITWNTEGGAFIDNTQRQLADVGAEVYGTVLGAGSVDISATAICNNLTGTNEKSSGTAVRNDQRCMTLDPYAVADVTVAGVGGDALIAATAVGNNLGLTAETAATWVYNTQINASATNATVNANLSDVGGNVDISATAIGNNLSINGRFGGN
jgi:hypothetical protein